MNDYQWYLYSCDRSGLKPVSAKRFEVMLAAYLQDFKSTRTIDFWAISPQKRLRYIRRWSRLIEIATLADAGRGTITAGTVVKEKPNNPLDDDPRFGRQPKPDDYTEFPPDAAPGVREPRRPIDPILVGVGSRKMPTPEDQPRYYAT